jgi:uncharacterized protein YggT (Ycf19 family)
VEDARTREAGRVEPIRRALPRTGMFDLSPLIVFFGITILMQIIVAVF